MPPASAIHAFCGLLEESDCLNYIDVSLENHEKLDGNLEEILKSEFLIEILKYCEGKCEEKLIEKAYAVQEIFL